MAKKKRQRFAENATFHHLLQPVITFPLPDQELKGNWHRRFFQNTNPIVLELGCGRGEYTIHLSKKFPDKNFIGVDWKGARLWRGAKTVQEEEIKNVAFLRIQIQHIEAFFSAGEVDEIWITFPDPQLQQSRERKRLTSPRFLDLYKKFLKPGGHIHLKTDSYPFYAYSLDVVNSLNLEVIRSTDDLYASSFLDDILSIKTTYEKMWLAAGSKICYLEFAIDEKDRR